MAIHISLYFVFSILWFCVNCEHWFTRLSDHRWPTTPVMILTTWTFLTNNFEGAILSIYSTPIVVNTILVSGAYLPYWRSFVPIMVNTNRSVFTNYLLMNTIPHLFHVLDVLLFRFTATKRSHTMSITFEFPNSWVFEICFVHVSKHPFFSLCFSTSTHFFWKIWPFIGLGFNLERSNWS